MECGNKMSQRGQDQDALLRMGGRLRRSTLPPEPNIQSSYHTITRSWYKTRPHKTSYTGMDFAGPLFVRPEVQGRNT
ncbi:hypothetical protein TPS_00052 [Trichinella pseudospiralis]